MKIKKKNNAAFSSYLTILPKFPLTFKESATLSYLFINIIQNCSAKYLTYVLLIRLFKLTFQISQLLEFIYVSFFENFRKLHKIYMIFAKFSN